MYSRQAPDSPVPADVVADRLARLESLNREARARSAGLIQRELTAEPVALTPPVDDDNKTSEIVWKMLGWLWAGRMIILAALAIGLVAGFVLPKIVPPRYASYVDLIVGLPGSQVLPDTDNTINTRDSQLLELDSRLRMLTSTNVLLRAVTALELDKDREFVGIPPLSLPFFSSPPDTDDARMTATRALFDKVSAWRDTQSYVVTLQVYSEDPQKSVRIAGAIVEAFQQEVWDSDRQTSANTVEALRARLSELDVRVRSAEEAVESFKRENGLQDSAGQLLANQSLSQFNVQLNDARAELINAESLQAKLAASSSANLGRVDNFDNETLATLRGNYYTLRSELDAQTAVYGARHPSVVKLQPQVASALAAVNQEVARMRENAAADVARARAVVDQLTAQLTNTRQSVSDEDAALIHLRALQREAETQGAIYETYLKRLSEISERGQMELTTLRVISPALPAIARSWPPRAVVLIPAGGVLGALIGIALVVGLGFWREYWPTVRAKLAPQTPAK